MKSLSLLFTFLIALILVTSTYAVINEPGQGTYADNTGTVKVYDGLWTTVKNSTGSTIASGSLVKYTTGIEGFNVALTDTIGENSACFADGAILDGAVGKCRIYGRQVVLFEEILATDATLGSPLYATDVTDGYVGNYVSTTSTHAQVGYALTTCAATGTCEIMVNIK